MTAAHTAGRSHARKVDVLVVGGGAAGLMCAITAGKRGKRVVVIEHANRVGKKILMSGGGRCNFTNTGTTPANFLSSNPHFCKSALARYTPWHFLDMVDSHGIAWHEKELGQLFCDDSSKLIVKMLLEECAAVGVEVETGCSIAKMERVHPAESDFPRSAGSFNLHTTRGIFNAPALVVASGGLSIPSMGASGFGYDVAKQFGHAVLPLRAGLVPLTLSGTHQQHLADLSGVSLPIAATANEQSFNNFMLVTHRGLSGPAILQVSSYWQPGDPLQIDLLPGADALETLKRLQDTRPAAELKTLLAELFPKRFSQRLCEVWLDHLQPARPIRQFNLPQLRQIAAILQCLPIVPSGTEGYRTAEVTLGGVDTNGVSSSSMESRHVPGLYFIGEVLDVTGWLGGYNFQWAWASGHAAGTAV